MVRLAGHENRPGIVHYKVAWWVALATAIDQTSCTMKLHGASCWPRQSATFDAPTKTFELVSIAGHISIAQKFSGAAAAPNGLIVCSM